jgi:hypothetical protein
VAAGADVLDGRASLRASGDFTLGDRDDSVDCPSRSLVGVDYRLTPDVTLFAEYEHAEGDRLTTDMTRIGARARPWEGAQAQSSVSQEMTEHGPRSFANFGLTQSFRLDERWAADFGVDQSNTLRRPGLAPFNPAAPLASGSLTEDFFAAFAGAQFQSERWTWANRFEHRNADSEERWSMTSGLYRETARGRAVSIALQSFRSDLPAGARSTASDLALAWAYRPHDSPWIVLNRLDLKIDERRDLVSRVESARIVENVHANWQRDARTQLGLQLGARYVESTFDGERYDGVSLLLGLDARRDLDARHDIGVHGAVLGSLESDVNEHSFGVDLGRSLARNVWAAIGYNFAGFRDGDFSASRYTQRGPYLKFQLKLDQDTFKDLRLDSLRPPR